MDLIKYSTTWIKWSRKQFCNHAYQFGNKLFTEATPVSLHTMFKCSNKGKSLPYLELKKKIFIHISNTMELENQSFQARVSIIMTLKWEMTLLNFKYATVQVPHVNILHLWLILFSYYCCISSTEIVSKINTYELITWNWFADNM